MLTDLHYAARDMVLRVDTPRGPTGPMLGVVPKFGRTAGGVATPGPVLGQDTRAVLAELAGVDDEEWSGLLAGGLVARSGPGQ